MALAAYIYKQLALAQPHADIGSRTSYVNSKSFMEKPGMARLHAGSKALSQATILQQLEELAAGLIGTAPPTDQPLMQVGVSVRS